MRSWARIGEERRKVEKVAEGESGREYEGE
jgi:hypothetical protein